MGLNQIEIKSVGHHRFNQLVEKTFQETTGYDGQSATETLLLYDIFPASKSVIHKAGNHGSGFVPAGVDTSEPTRIEWQPGSHTAQFVTKSTALKVRDRVSHVVQWLKRLAI